MRLLVVGSIVMVAGAGAVTPSSGAVLCQKKSGVVVVRSANCGKKETSLNLAQFGAVGPKGDKGDPGMTGSPGSPGAPGAAGSAVAYARVRATASLDATRSKNIVDVLRETGFSAGVYCLYGNFTPKNVVATVDWTDSSGGEYVQEIALDSLGSCPASSTGAPALAFVITRLATDSSLHDAGFYIAFN